MNIKNKPIIEDITNIITQPKITNPLAKATTKPITKTKVCDYYLDLFSFREKPISIAFIERLAKDILDYSNDPKVLNMMPFFGKMGMSYSTFRKLKEKHPILKEVYEHCLELLGARREYGAITRNLEASIINRSMAIYSYEYRQLEVERAERRNSEKDHTTGTITVVMESFASEKTNIEK